jgi:hypothetical protein
MFPLLLAFGKVPAPFRQEPVILAPAADAFFAPVGFNQAALFQAFEGQIKRAFFEFKAAVGLFFDPLA